MLLNLLNTYDMNNTTTRINIKGSWSIFFPKSLYMFNSYKQSQSLISRCWVIGSVVDIVVQGRQRILNFAKWIQSILYYQMPQRKHSLCSNSLNYSWVNLGSFPIHEYFPAARTDSYKCIPGCQTLCFGRSPRVSSFVFRKSSSQSGKVKPWWTTKSLFSQAGLFQFRQQWQAHTPTTPLLKKVGLI